MVQVRDDYLRQQEIAEMKITPFLWFDTQAEEAARFYTSVFENSHIIDTRHYGEAGPGPKGSVMSVTFMLDGQRFIALNGGPHCSFSPAISFFVDCATQEEVDALWHRLSAGGEALRCGWLTDKYGVSWQIIPSALGEMLRDQDAERSGSVMRAMLGMDKIEIAGLKRAYVQRQGEHT